jgi:DNA-binding NarL/FixJ family response regulator
VIRVVVADDHEVVRSGFATMLRTQPDIDVVGGAADGAEAVRQCQEQPVDVVLMDIRMPVLDGIEATRAITKRLIAEVLHLRRSAPVALSEPLAPLTPRESDVLLLVAEGLSNAEIAGRLFISEDTVKSHVGRILIKLDLRDRTQAVVYAYESGMVVPRGRQDGSPDPFR